MEVILLERIERLGQMGEVVKVKPGFARNYLLPQKKALRATSENRAYFESQRQHLEAQNLSRRGDAEKVAETLNGVRVVVLRQAGESGQLYGSVNTRDIVEALHEAGFTVERRQVNLASPIKALGLHPLKISLHPEVAVSVTVNVAKSEEEAEAQATAPPEEAFEAVSEEPKAAKKKKRARKEAEAAEGGETGSEKAATDAGS
ncbi:MAG: 50S ribosomal protein L9 [Alphaproteobacteria bacterium]